MFIACDPGKNGGLVFTEGWPPSASSLNEMGLAIVKMPESFPELYELLRDMIDGQPFKFFIENVPKWTGGLHQSNSSSATLHHNFGFVHGVAMALGGSESVELLTPQAWQKAIDCKNENPKLKRPQWKNKLKAKAQSLFPGRDVTLWNADALLILYAGTLLQK
jgi:hypothetical protein